VQDLIVTKELMQMEVILVLHLGCAAVMILLSIIFLQTAAVMENLLLAATVQVIK